MEDDDGRALLHSSIFRLNVTAFCGTRGALSCCLGGVKVVWWGSRGYAGCTQCYKRLRLS